MNDFSVEEMTDRSATLSVQMAPEVQGLRVYQAICNVMADLSKIGIAKDRKNVQQGYPFRGIDDVYGALSPLLAKHRLCILPRIVERVSSERTTKSGTVMFHTAITVDYDLVSAIDGSRHTSRMPGEGLDTGDKSVNKALSAAYKYMAFKVFCIPVEGEPDADAVTPPETVDSVDATETVESAGLPKDRVVTWLENTFKRSPGAMDLTKLTRTEFRVLADKLPELARRYAEETMKLGGVSA